MHTVYNIYIQYAWNTRDGIRKFQAQIYIHAFCPPGKRKGMVITMEIILSNSSGVPIYEQIVKQLKALILRGDLREGEALPSMRLLARELRISVITTKRAYEELEREGFISTVPGKGSFVAPQDPELYREDTLRRAEEHLAQAVEIGRLGGISLPELQQTLTILYGDE